MFKHTQIYFLSGTGNSFRVASWIHETALQQGGLANLTPIEAARPSEEIYPGADSLLALVFPTHGFTTPWAMLKFALRLPACKATSVIVLPTRAGVKFGRVFLPGLEGTAGYLLAAIFALKGYRIRGVMALDMPSNWIALHPGFSIPSAQAIIQRARPKLNLFLHNIYAGKNDLRGIIPLLLGLALLPVSAGYLLIGRFGLCKLFFATNRCDGCGLCARNCPANAIVMKGKHPPRPYWTFSCESCMRCMNFCPKQAIEASHLLAVVFLMITNVSASVLLLNWISSQISWISRLNNSIVSWLLQYVYILTSMAVVYWLFSKLICVPWINTFFSYATLTRFYRRYHEPDTKLEQLKKNKLHHDR
ncbi:MAG: 4Fe-4S binding protein [Anaerolineae bacterium]|nr:4Fe-4S binding protein [Anaerolineae bacterium]